MLKLEDIKISVKKEPWKEENNGKEVYEEYTEQMKSLFDDLYEHIDVEDMYIMSHIFMRAFYLKSIKETNNQNLKTTLKRFRDKIHIYIKQGE